MKKNTVIPIILLTHGNWGVELIKSAEMVTGKLEAIKAFPLMPADSVNAYKNRITDFLDSLEEGKALILTDVLGGTPFRMAGVLVATREHIEAVSGLNMDLLILADRLRGEYAGEELVAEIVKEAGKTILNIKEFYHSSDGM